MDKRLALVGMVAVASATAAITHNLSKHELPCATKYDVKAMWEHRLAEDDYCVAYWHGDRIIIGPLSDVEGYDHIVGSPTD